jgi:Zn-dependent metalloprotease
MYIRMRVAAVATAIAMALTACTSLSPHPSPPDRTAPTVEVLAIAGDGGFATLRQTGDAGPIGDPEADRAFEHAGRALAHFYERFGRDSFDGRGSTLTLYVGLTDDQWPWAAAIAWDRGMKVILCRTGFAALDLIAHELVHAIVQASADHFRRSSDASAEPLEEALADILAAGVDGNWTVGEDALGGPFRDLADPARFGHATHVEEFDPGDGPEATYSNSLIVSHAYYLLAQEVGREAAEEIVWVALMEKLGPAGSGFEEFRAASLAAAAQLHGEASTERQAVEEAFAAVGLDGSWRAPERPPV